MQQGGPWPCSQEVQGADGHAQEGEKGPIRRPDKRFSEGSHDRETTPQVRRPRRTAYSRTRPCHPWRVDGAGPTAAPSAAANGAGCERGSALRSRRRCGPSTDAHLGGSCGEYEYTPADRERKTHTSARQPPSGTPRAWPGVSGSGAQPREIFLPFNRIFQAKSTYHTTYRTSLESSH